MVVGNISALCNTSLICPLSNVGWLAIMPGLAPMVLGPISLGMIWACKAEVAAATVVGLDDMTVWAGVVKNIVITV